MEAQNETTPEEAEKLNKAKVEKLKRRIIRAVASKTSQNADENEMKTMWETMSKSSKCDCKVLWQHMRAVTLKKLKRLLPAEDRIENITAIARLTVTDWLLFDLVLVHEKVDVIGQDLWEESGEEPEPLIELLFLVVEHDIENLEGTRLIDAWLHLTREYNKAGCKCSPMMLQRRWYQMKEVARKKFYNFWMSYRGSSLLLHKAMKYKPTALQVNMVRKYRHVVLKSFPSWNDLIATGKVILAHEFDKRIQSLRKGKKDTGPELELIEQEVETISLEGDSDSNDVNVYENYAQDDVPHVRIKEEPEADDLIEINDELDILEKTNIPCETPFGNNEDIPPLIIDCKNTNSCANMPAEDLIVTETQIASENKEVLEGNCNKDKEVLSTDNTSPNVFKSKTNDKDFNNLSRVSMPLTDNQSTRLVKESPLEYVGISNMSVKSSLKVPKVIKSRIADDFKPTNNYEEDPETCHDENNFDTLPEIKNVTSFGKICQSATTKNKIESILGQKAKELPLKRDCSISLGHDFLNNSQIEFVTNVTNENLTSDKELLGNFEEFPSDIQFVDDGIVVDDDDERCTKVEGILTVEEEKECDEHNEIDEKLIMVPMVCTKKLDDMDVFKFLHFHQVKDKSVIERAFLESNPINNFSHKEYNSCNHYGTSSKEASTPIRQENIVIKEENSLLDQSNQTNEFHENSIIQAIAESNKDTESSDDDIPLRTIKNRVHIDNWMLKKPHVTNYSPILLCRNPDFNIRLKRLTAGFLSYEINRQYLKECKPLTIDLHKSFENKLSDKTLYLNGVNKSANKATVSSNAVVEQESITTKASCQIVTSDNSVITSNNSPIQCERNKVIHLPNITEIRRLNQQLQTAEVAPLQITAPLPSVAGTSKIINVNSSEKSKYAMQELDKINTKLNISIQHSNVCDNSDVPNIGISLDKTIVASNKDIFEKNGTDKVRNRVKNVTEKRYKAPNPKISRSYTDVPWLMKPLKLRDEESLLASDTFDKMLLLFSGEDNNTEKKKRKLKKGKRSKPLQDIKGQIETPKPKQKSEIDDCKSPYLNFEDKVTETKSKNKVYCCWALRKCWHPNLKKPHPCKKPFCNCCCRDKLIKKIKQHTKKRTQAQSPTIVLSDDENNDVTKPKAVSVVKVGQDETLQRDPEKASIIVNGETTKVIVPHCVVRSKTPRVYSERVVVGTCQLPRSDTHNMNTKPQNSETIDITENQPSMVDTDDIKNITRESSLELECNELETENFSNIPYHIPAVGANEVVITNKDMYVNSREQKSNSRLPTKNFIKESKLVIPRPKGAIIAKAKIGRPKRSIRAKLTPDGEIVLNYSVSDAAFYDTSQLKPDGLHSSSEEGLIDSSIPVKIKKPKPFSPEIIFIGENKILLSTVKNPLSPRMSIDPPQISLPKGVHFVLLPNNELALSIEPGIALDSGQLSHLQSVILTLQKLLGIRTNNFINTEDNRPIVIDDEEVNINSQSKDNQIEIKSQTGTIEKLETDKQMETYKELETNEKLQFEKQLEFETQLESDNRVENNETVIEAKTSNTNIAGDMNINLNETYKNSDSIEVNPTENKSIVSELSNSEQNSSDVHNTQNKENKSRKTILSDLMEMSGISEEDAKSSDSPGPSTNAPFTQCEIKENSDDSVRQMHPDILKLFNTPIALAALTRRPDLSIVTTYDDLKYAFNQKASFYKLDVTTGQISRLRLIMKKNGKTYKTLPEIHSNADSELIDLTADDNEDESLVIESCAPNFNKKVNVNKHAGGTSNDAKPLKLFRATHCSILDQTLIKDLEMKPHYVGSDNLLRKLERKKMMKIVNINRRKQNLSKMKKKSLNPLVVTELEPLAAIVNLYDSSSDDSDNEPLAKKIKRKERTENLAEIKIKPIDSDTIKNIDPPLKPPAIVEFEDTLIFEKGYSNLEGPENTENNDCILGV